MSRQVRPLFKGGMEWVAVKRIKRGKDENGEMLYYEPGDTIVAKTHLLRYYYRGNRIGPKGHPWTQQAIESFSKAKFPASSFEKVSETSEPVSEDTDSKEVETQAETETITPETEPATEPTNPVNGKEIETDSGESDEKVVETPKKVEKATPPPKKPVKRKTTPKRKQTPKNIKSGTPSLKSMTE